MLILEQDLIDDIWQALMILNNQRGQSELGDIEKEVLLFTGIYRNQLTKVCVASWKSCDTCFSEQNYLLCTGRRLCQVVGTQNQHLRKVTVVMLTLFSHFSILVQPRSLHHQCQSASCRLPADQPSSLNSYRYYWACFLITPFTLSLAKTELKIVRGI